MMMLFFYDDKDFVVEESILVYIDDIRVDDFNDDDVNCDINGNVINYYDATIDRNFRDCNVVSKVVVDSDIDCDDVSMLLLV